MARHLAQRVFVSYLLKTPLQLQKSLNLERYLFLGIFTCQKRLSHKDVEILDHTCEIANYNDYRINYKPIVHVVMQTLKEILNISTTATKEILANHPQLKKRSRVNILNNYYNLLEAGIQKNTITKNIWLLAHDDTKLKKKIDCINTLKMNNEELIPWLQFTQHELMNNINYIRNDPVPYTYNKIEYLAYKLECSIEELCKLLVQYPFLLKIPVSSIDKKLNVLHEYNISNKDILKDLWVLRYNEDHIQHRCELYKSTGNLEIQTWVIRCALGVITKDKDPKILTTKYSNNLQKKPIKWNKIITILQENGISRNEIIKSGGPIFCFTLKTIQKRIKILKRNDIPVKITPLKMSEEIFKRFIERCEISSRRNRLRLSYQDNEKYLICKLNIDEETVKNFVKNWPLATKIDILKLEELFDTLYQYGFTNNEIVTQGRIIYFKVESIRKRLETLKEVGITPKINMLITSTKYFNNFVKSHTMAK